MSLVIALATDRHIVLKTDGRECSAIDNHVVDEYSNKSIEINNKTIMGYTGNKQLCEALALDTKDRFNGKQFKIKDIITFFEFNFQIMKLSNLDAQFVLCFIENATPYIISWSSSNNFQRDVKGAGGYCILGTDIADATPFEYDFNITVDENMDNYIYKIASLDSSVNTNITTRKIFV